MEPGLLPAFHCAEALAAVLLNEVVGQPQKDHPVGGGAAEVGEFCQQGRKIPVGAHRIAVYHHRVPHGAIGHHPVHRSAEIQAFVVLQSQIRAGVLAVQIQQGAGVLPLPGLDGLSLHPGAQRQGQGD